MMTMTPGEAWEGFVGDQSVFDTDRMTLEQVEALIALDRLDGLIAYYGVASDTPLPYFANQTDYVMERFREQDDYKTLAGFQASILLHGGVAPRYVAQYCEEFNDMEPCPSCRGSSKGEKDVRYDADRGQWMTYRGGWYPCEACAGTGVALR